MAATYVAISALDAVLDGSEIVLPETTVALIDSTTGYDGPGCYHIALSPTAGPGSTPGYSVAYGLPPGDTSSLMTILRVVLTPTGDLVFQDVRKLNVGVVAVNSTIAQTAFTDGSFLQSGVVTERTLAGDVFGPGGFLDHYGTAQGDILYRGASGWTVLSPGTSGYVLQTGGAAANPSWVTPGGGGSGGTIFGYGSSFPGSPADKLLFYRTDLKALFAYLNSSPGPGWFNVDALAQLADVSLGTLSNNQLLTYSSGGGIWTNTSLTALIDAAIGSTRGAVLYRGASGWAILAPGTSGYVLTSAGSGMDPAWAAGAAGVTSLNGETGGLTIGSADGSIDVTTPSGTTINLAATAGGGSLYDSAILAESSLIAYYKMAETMGTTMVDSKGSNDGTYHGAFTFGAPLGMRDGSKGVYLNSAGSGYANTPASGVTTPTAWSIEAIVRCPTNAIQGGYPVLFSTQSADSGGSSLYKGVRLSYGIAAYASGLYWVYGDGSASHFNSFQVEDVPGRPVHYVITYDGTTMTFYMNGMVIYSALFTVVWSPYLAIGAFFNSGIWTSFANQIVGKVALYNAVLTQAQVFAHLLVAGI